MSFAVAGITSFRANLKLNFFAIAIGCCVFLALSILLGDFEIGGYDANYHQTKGITGNPNDFAYLILLAVPALLYFFRKRASLMRRGILAAILAFMVLGILASGSRKTFVGFVALILLWMWMCYKKDLSRKPGLAFTLVFIIVTVSFLTNYMLANTYMGKRFKIDLVEKREYVEDNIRIMLYQEGFEMIKNNPIFGVGLGNFQALSKIGTESHSDYIEIAACTGIVGFLLYFSIYVLLWQRLSRIGKVVTNHFVSYEIGLLKATILMILILAFVRPNFKSQITWIFLASAIGYAHSLEKKSEHAFLFTN
jgi:O-antigen ligase